MVRYPIFYAFGDGVMLYATLARVDGLVCVGVEDASGAPFGGSWSRPAAGRVGSGEFIANTWGDDRGLMASAMMATGLFEKTGRSVLLDGGEECEIWRLSFAGERWLLNEHQVVNSPAVDVPAGATPLRLSDRDIACFSDLFFAATGQRFVRAGVIEKISSLPRSVLDMVRLHGLQKQFVQDIVVEYLSTVRKQT